MVGQWYCVPDGCSRVLWQEYDGGYLRYRYPGENWKRVDGQDLTYSTEQQPGQCPIPYRLAGTYTRYNNQTRTWRVGDVCRNDVYGPIGNLVNVPTNDFTNGNNWQIECHDGVGNPHTVPLFAWYGYCVGLASENKFGTTPKITLIAPLDPNAEDNCGDCTFTVKRDGEIIYIETREVCPEVEQVDCELQSYQNGISLEKLSYLERVEVVDFAYEIGFQGEGLLSPKKPIPPNCLNIYISSTQPSILPVTDLPANWKFITQICSTPTCPPPKYEVFCVDCKPDCESCPEGTCAVNCGDHVCCYDEQGIAVKSIELTNYCG